MTSRRSRTLLVAIALCLVPAVASADAGIPMLVFVWPGAWASFVPIVAIELFVARRTLGLGAARALRVSLAANAVSTLVGIPLTWLVAVVFEMSGAAIVSGFDPPELPRWLEAALFPMYAAWLPPAPEEGWWLVALAAAFLCVPFFLVSVWVEAKVASRLLPEVPPAAIERFSRIANAVTYGLIVAGLLAGALVLHG